MCCTTPELPPPPLPPPPLPVLSFVFFLLILLLFLSFLTFLHPPSCCPSSSSTNLVLSGFPPVSPSSPVSCRWGRITRSFQQRLCFVAQQLWATFHCVSECVLSSHVLFTHLLDIFLSTSHLHQPPLSLSVVHFCCFHVSLTLCTFPVLGGIVCKLNWTSNLHLIAWTRWTR